jgi:hypothetical protein
MPPAVLAGIGGAVLLLIIVVVVIATGGPSYKVPGVSPDLGEPKTAAQSYLEFRWARYWNGKEVSAAQNEKKLSEREAKADFYEDPDQYRKDEIKSAEARAKFTDDKEDDLEKRDITVDSVEGTDERKTAKYTIKYKEVRLKEKDGKPMEGTEVDHYELKDQELKGTLTLALIGGQWRLVEAGGDGFIVPRGKGD